MKNMQTLTLGERRDYEAAHTLIREKLPEGKGLCHLLQLVRYEYPDCGLWESTNWILENIDTLRVSVKDEIIGKTYIYTFLGFSRNSANRLS